ncbi:MAG: hypothetical protein PHI97_21230 [Desulfobulbus sp.]|nr:hypothetical protein [Desulfobulbus sp.]
MTTQQIPPFTHDALALLFARDNFLAFQKPGFASHYWAPLLAACCGASRNEIFFLYPDDLVQQQGEWCLCLRSVGSKEAQVRQVPLHAWLQQLGFIAFVQNRLDSKPNERLFNEYKAGLENGGMLFSRAFVQWIKTTVSALPVQQQPIFAEDFHFPSLRALFWQEAKRAGISDANIELLRDAQNNPGHAAIEMARIAIEFCFPTLPPFAALRGEHQK